MISPTFILQLIQLLVLRASLQKRFVRGLVYDATFAHHDDLVGVENRGQAVRDGDDGFAF